MIHELIMERLFDETIYFYFSLIFERKINLKNRALKRNYLSKLARSVKSLFNPTLIVVYVLTVQ